MIGQVIGNYRLVGELGKGGMGVVYVAEHVQLGRPAALKMLLPQFSSDEAIVTRFFNEARAASAIDHPGIVEIYDFGTHVDGRAYIVMALLQGETLQQRIAREPLTPIEGATIVAQVAGALAAAHARGIVHRDLKPDNIFLVANEMMTGGVQAKLLDFGIAKLTDEGASFKTQTGSLIGTPAYMSPEQCMGSSALDHRTDLYALGCILFHLLCGRPPFISESGAGPMIAAHLRDPAPDPRVFNPYIPEVLAYIVLRLLEKDPAARYQTATELRDALMNAGANVSITRSMPAERMSAPRYTGPEAYNATTAPTTSSGSAAQLVTPPPSGKSKGIWVLVAGAAIAAAGITAVIVVSAKQDEPPRIDPPVAATAPSVDAHVASAPVVVDAAEPLAEKPLDACPVGQSRGPDTQNQCCWPEQAWSSAKNRCIGTPRCPDGMQATRDEKCVTVVAASSVPDADADVPKFTLNATTYAPGDPVVIRFAKPVPSTGNRRAWVTIVEASRSKDSWGVWEFVPDKAKSVSLKAPSTAGKYEARVHTDYGVKSSNVRYVVALEIVAAEKPAPPPTVPATPLAQQRFRVKSAQLAPREEAVVMFPGPMKAAPNERFWVTVAKAGESDDQYGAYEYVPDLATSMTLGMPAAPGEYELRLHANYPTKSRNVVHRVRVTVVDQ